MGEFWNILTQRLANGRSLTICNWLTCWGQLVDLRGSNPWPSRQAGTRSSAEPGADCRKGGLVDLGGVDPPTFPASRDALFSGAGHRLQKGWVGGPGGSRTPDLPGKPGRALQRSRAPIAERAGWWTWGESNPRPSRQAGTRSSAEPGTDCRKGGLVDLGGVEPPTS